MIKTAAMFRSIALASALGIIGTGGAALAAPVAPGKLISGASAASETVLVRDRDGRHRADRNRDRRLRDGRSHRRHWDHQHWNRDTPHYGAPRSWRRYHSRPYDWRRRGCAMFGPVWFCP